MIFKQRQFVTVTKQRHSYTGKRGYIITNNQNGSFEVGVISNNRVHVTTFKENEITDDRKKNIEVFGKQFYKK